MHLILFILINRAVNRRIEKRVFGFLNVENKNLNRRVLGLVNIPSLTSKSVHRHKSRFYVHDLTEES